MEDLKKKYRSPMQWQFWIVRERINSDTGKVFTEDEAKFHVNSFRRTKFEYWLKRCSSLEEAQIEYDKFKEYSRELLKVEKEKRKGKKDVNTTQIGYWLKKGYSEEEAAEKLRERQLTFTLEKCIKKHGEEEGRKRYLERQIKWQETINNKEDQSFQRLKSLSLEMFIERGLTIDDYCKHRKNKDKSDEYLLRKTKEYVISNNLELNTETFNQYYYRFKRDLLKIRGFASRESLRYFIPMYKFCRRNGIDRDDIMLGLSGSKEFVISRNIPRKGDRGNKFRTFRFDFTILSKKLIFEYNHIDFHPDPDIMGEKFDGFTVPLSNMPAKEKYEYDKLKMRTAREHGYDLHIIWSHEDFDKQMKMAKDLILK
jgi:hypothetical protein